MGADSRAVKDGGYITDTRTKLFVSKNNVGVSTCGDRSVNGYNIEPYIEQFLESHSKSSVTEIANAITPFFLELQPDLDTIFHVCGFESDDNGNMVKRKYYVHTINSEVEENTFETGAIWNGTIDIMNMLIGQAYYKKDNGKFEPYSEYEIDWNHLNILEGVELIKFFIETTQKMMSFQNRRQSVGGKVEILLLRPNEHQWISKKELK